MGLGPKLALEDRSVVSYILMTFIINSSLHDAKCLMLINQCITSTLDTVEAGPQADNHILYLV